MPHETADLIARVRAEGFPEFRIKPDGEREVYTSIIFLEPLDERNLRAFGYDMFSEATRRVAMEHARDSTQASVSGRVVLLQETEQDVQAGFLMYLPVYRTGAALDSVEQRRAALKGFVYSPFRMRDLMQGILGQGTPGLDFKLYDGTQAGRDTLLFDTFLRAWGDETNEHPQRASYSSQKIIELPGRTWTAVFTSRKKFETEMGSNQPQLIVLGGALVDLMLFSIIWSLSQQRKRVVATATKMTAELRRSREQFRAITDTAYDAIISTDVKSEILYGNPAASTLFGYSVDKLIGMAIEKLLPDRRGDDKPSSGSAQNPGQRSVAQQCSLPLLLEEGRSTPVCATFEAVGRRSDDSAFPLEVSISNWQADDQTYFTLLIRDISERKRIEKLKNEFVSTVSHELRTPLTAIRGALGLVRVADNDSISITQRTELIGIAYQNTERLVRLVNDILDLEKLESGRLVLELQPVDLPNLLRQSITENQYYAIQHAISLVLAEPIPDISLRADPNRLMQVLANFISNAIKFSRQGKTVTLSASAQNNRLRVSVTDTGIGIPEEFRDSVFQRFTQVDATDSRQKGGSGLGLSNSKSIIQLHGGTIGYDTEVDKGSCFYFELTVESAPKTNNC